MKVEIIQINRIGSPCHLISSFRNQATEKYNDVAHRNQVENTCKTSGGSQTLYEAAYFQADKITSFKRYFLDNFAKFSMFSVISTRTST